MRLRPKNTTTANRQDPNCASAKSVGNTVATSGPDKRNVVEDERNHAPCRRELQTGEEGKDPDHQASQHAHGAADQHVSLELVGDLRARLQDGSRDVLVVEALDVLPGDIDLEQAESGEYEGDDDERHQTVQPSADLLHRA